MLHANKNKNLELVKRLKYARDSIVLYSMVQFLKIIFAQISIDLIVLTEDMSWLQQGVHPRYEQISEISSF